MIKNYYYTCSAIIDGKLFAETFFIASREEAYNTYIEKYGVKPEFMDGPFYRKIEKNKRKIKSNTVQLTNKIIKGIWKDFPIKGVILKEPKDYVYLIFIDNKNKSININTNNIVHLSEIKEIK